MREQLNFDIETPESGRIQFPLQGIPFAQMLEAIQSEPGNTGRLIR